MSEVSPVLQALYRGDDDAVAALRPSASELDLYEAAALGEADRLRELLAADPGAVGTLSVDGFTPLHLAAFFGHPDAVALLLEHGAPVDTYAESSFARVTPLGSAAAAAATDAARLLLEAGADPNLGERVGNFTPLHAAAQNGAADLVRVLLEHGADPGATSDDGRTPRDLAADDEIRALL